MSSRERAEKSLGHGRRPRHAKRAERVEAHRGPGGLRAGKLFKGRKRLVLPGTLGHVLASCVLPANAADGPAVIAFWDEAADQTQSM